MSPSTTDFSTVSDIIHRVFPNLSPLGRFLWKFVLLAGQDAVNSELSRNEGCE